MVTLLKVKHLHGVISEDEWNGERIDWFIEDGNDYECVATTELNHIPKGKHKTYRNDIGLSEKDLEIIRRYVEEKF